MPIESHDAAYLAGFLDGDGYITIRRSNCRKAKNPAYRLVIGFTNTDLSVLTWIAKTVGAGCINPKSRSDEARHAPAFELTIHQRDIQRNLLASILPFSKVKVRQIETAIAFLDLGRIKKSMVSRGKTWPIFQADPADVLLREEFKTKLGGINKRGPDCLQ